MGAHNLSGSVGGNSLIPAGSDNFSVIQFVSRINGVIPILHLEDLSEIKFTNCCACWSAVRTYVCKSV